MASLVGKVLLNRYRVDAHIASGGMGTVYRAWDIERNVPLAMKVLHLELGEDPDVLRRFKREANALKNLAHPNIVTFYGLEQANNFYFLLEQFIDGLSLKDVIEQSAARRLSIGDALIYLKALSAALGFAHRNGVVHCDVKPGNVLVDRGGNIYLTDFGVARHAESTTTSLGTAGTVAYMAPEQISGKLVTPAADVYALGIMLYEMLAGRRPFTGSDADISNSGETAAERVRYAHLQLQPPDPRLFNPDLPESVAYILLRALAKNPADRYESTDAFFEAVCDALGARPELISNRTSPLEWREPEPPVPEGEPETIWQRYRTLLVTVGVSAILLLFCSGAFLASRIAAIGSLLASDTPLPSNTQEATQTPIFNQLDMPAFSPTSPPTATLRPTDTPLPTSTLPPTAMPAPPTEPPAPPPATYFFVRNIRAEAIAVYVNGKFYTSVLSNQVMQIGFAEYGNVDLKWCRVNTTTWKSEGNCRTKTFNITAAGQNITLGY